MKLANCNEHPNENKPEFSCWALRHEDGRRVTPEEMLSAIDSAVLVEREACAKVCEEESGVAAEMGHERFARYSAEMAGKIRMRSLSNAGLGLLPCPFCGSEPKTWWDIKHEDECYCEGFNISCTRCDSVSKCCIDKIDAIAAWNTRA